MAPGLLTKNLEPATASQPANPFLFLFLVCGKRRGRVNFLHNENGKILYLLGLARNRGSACWPGDRLSDQATVIGIAFVALAVFLARRIGMSKPPE